MSSHSSINGVESDRVVSNKASSLHIGERLNKLEQFFERFANRKSSTVSTPPGVSPSSWLEKSEERSIHGLPKCSMDIRNPSSISHTFVSLVLILLLSENILTGLVSHTDMDVSNVQQHTSCRGAGQ